MTIVDRGERRDRVDHEQCRVAGSVDRGADLGDAAGNPGRGLVVHDANRLQAMRSVGGQLLFDDRRVDTVPPVAGYELYLKPEPARHLVPQAREMPGLEHDHSVARRQCVRKRRLPRPGAGRGIDDDGVLGLEHPLHAGDALLPERGEFQPAMVDRRRRNRLQYPVGYVCRPWDLQKMAAGVQGGSISHRHGISRGAFVRRSYCSFPYSSDAIGLGFAWPERHRRGESDKRLGPIAAELEMRAGRDRQRDAWAESDNLFVITELPPHAPSPGDDVPDLLDRVMRDRL